MTKIALTRNPNPSEPAPFRAVAGPLQATGRTAGEAVDALTAQLSEEQAETLLIIRALQPDRFFSADQRQRLDDLMIRWRAARDASGSLPPEDQAELERLVDAEFQAATARAESLAQQPVTLSVPSAADAQTE